jgi:hypothetical protein
MYESMAKALLRAHGKRYRELRRALVPLQTQLQHAEGKEQREGLALVCGQLRAKLDQLEPEPYDQPDLPLAPSGGGQ